MIQAGDTIGPYTLIRPLGRGGFGEVWLAERRSSLLTTRVALKLALDSAIDIDAVRDEAQIWLKASGHTNIVPVLEAEIYDGQVVIASEYAAGGSLAEWLTGHAGKSPAVEAAIALMGGVLSGLEHLHKNNLIHRDLKPANVLLQGSTPRLTDFGLTRVLTSSGHTTNLAGTPGYMAPEVFRGQYSVASDLWAAGVLLHELLTGSLPYLQSDYYMLLLAISGDDPAPISDQVPEALQPIVATALAKSPGDRFVSAAAMAEALDTAVSPGARVSVGSAAGTRSNLPIQMTSFIGRDRELAEVKALLGKARLLTLTGSGGTGKTRLLLQAAADVQEDFPDGVWLVELAPVLDPQLVPQAVASVLGVREEPGTALTQTLSDSLHSKQMLLLLDNCEHVLDAVASLTNALLIKCSGVKVFGSSREGLGIAGETGYRVPSLSIPDLRRPTTTETVVQFESARLFVERAVAAKPGFLVTSENAQALASICNRLDGIPLAIELAAARVRSLTPAELERRLDDRFRILTGGSRTALPRQQALRAMIDWSYDLLEDNLKALLARLAVFMGGWTLEAAEMVCAGGSVEEWEMLDLLTALCDKSLVTAEECGQATRYRILETVRQYAREKLASQPEGTRLRRGHRDYFLGVAEEAKSNLAGPEQAAWLERLETEHDNLRQALAFSLEEPEEGRAGLRLGNALSMFWYIRGNFSEGRERLTALLSHPLAQERTLDRAGALNGAGIFARIQGDYAESRSLHSESIAVERQLGDMQRLAVGVNNLALVVQEQGDFSYARALFEESLAIGRELGDASGVANCLNNLGIVAKEQNSYTSAFSLYTESLAIYRQLGNRQSIACSLNNLGELAQVQGDYVSARAWLDESLAIHRELGGRHGIAGCLGNLAIVALDQLDYISARSLFDESLALFRDLGDRRRVAMTLFNLAAVAERLGDAAVARQLQGESLELRRQLGDRCGIAYCLEGFAGLNATRGEREQAGRLWGAAERLREEIDSPIPPNEREDRGREIAAVREALGDMELDAAWAAGRALTEEQAIEFALENSVE